MVVRACCRYSVAVGPISFVVMSTEHDFSTGSAQLRALDTMLANVDRKLTPWVVFTGYGRLLSCLTLTLTLLPNPNPNPNPNAG